jgi:hypothetical protein
LRKLNRLQRTCAICACSDLMPCDDRGVPCYWITADLCSACARKHCPSIFEHTLEPRQRAGIANAAIRMYRATRRQAPAGVKPISDRKPAGYQTQLEL